MASKEPSDVSIGKFDILAAYAYVQALLHGADDDEAKQRGMVAAIMGAQARLGVRKEHREEFQAQKEAAEMKKPLAVNLFSNRAGTDAPAAGGVTIILLDSLNTMFAGEVQYSSSATNENGALVFRPRLAERQAGDEGRRARGRREHGADPRRRHRRDLRVLQ